MQFSCPDCYRHAQLFWGWLSVVQGPKALDSLAMKEADVIDVIENYMTAEYFCRNGCPWFVFQAARSSQASSPQWKTNTCGSRANSTHCTSTSPIPGTLSILRNIVFNLSRFELNKMLKMSYRKRLCACDLHNNVGPGKVNTVQVQGQFLCIRVNVIINTYNIINTFSWSGFPKLNQKYKRSTT